MTDAVFLPSPRSRAEGRVRGLFFAALALLLTLSVCAQAHRGHTSLSVVVIDLQAGTVTVTHHLVAHDVEPGLKQIAPDAQASLDDENAVKALTAYVGGRFSLAESSGGVTLQLKEVKLAGDDVQIVYSGRLLAPAGELRVRSRLFTDIYPAQQNQVNVRRGGVTRTVNFNADSETQTLPALESSPH